MPSTTDSALFAFDNSYAALPPDFHQRLDPTPVSQPGLIAVNASLAETLGVDPQQLQGDQALAVLAGNAVPEGASPLAMAYAGHQFGNWVPQLGDGRAVLLGEVIGRDGVRYDIQLKGAGPTRFSRGGDGRNWIGPVMREYLVSEAMAALGVPTTRALAAVSTGDHVFREQGALPGAVLTRVARSHIRVGTFQYFTARQNHQAVQQLLDYVIARHYPQAADAELPALAMLESVIEAQASLIAHWQSIGFIHGVMNTDNSSITGDTIDYGPCAFMDTYAADKVFSSIDRGARYAYQNQPRIAQWNLVNLAQCLLPLLHEDQEQAVSLAQAAIDRFDPLFLEAYLGRMRAKLGLADEQDDDLSLISDLLGLMQSHELDFTITFRQLSERSGSDPFAPGGVLHDWFLRWQQRITDNGEAMQAREAANALMQRSNPVIIPRNHQVEAVIEAAIRDDDHAPFHDMLAAVTHPFDGSLSDSEHARAPTDEQVVSRTFCGT